MPLFKTYKFDNNTQLLVWKISEDFDWLFQNSPLRDVSLARVDRMKSESHQKGFLSVRQLLAVAGYSDFDLYYDDNGKPQLQDGKHISITHSYDFSAIIISDKNVGIDMEKQRDKIVKIADKFCDFEFSYLDRNSVNYVRVLTVIWGAKEAKYKMCDSRSISFKDDMKVFPFHINEAKGEASIFQNDFEKHFAFHFEEFDGFTMVYAFER